jgi:hypothetical protein
MRWVFFSPYCQGEMPRCAAERVLSSRAMARDSELLMTPSISPFRRAKRELEGEDASGVFFRVSPIAERSYGGCRRA